MTTARKPYVPPRNAEEVKAMKEVQVGTLPKAQLSRETLGFLAELLAATTIRPTADDFEEVAARMGKARRELIAALNPTPPLD